MSDAKAPARYTVGLVQMAMSADPDANLKKAVAKISEAAAAGAQLVCLPELFRSQYFAQREDPELFDLAEPVPGPSTEAVGQVAKQAGVVVIAPVFERRAAGRQRAVLSDGDWLAPEGEGDARRSAARRLAHHPAEPRDRERLLRRSGEPGRPRATPQRGRRRHRVLGLVVSRRSVWRHRGRRTQGPRGHRAG